MDPVEWLQKVSKSFKVHQRKSIQEFAIMSEPIGPLSRVWAASAPARSFTFRKFRGKSLRLNFSAISLQILFILPKFIQIDLNCTPAKIEKKISKITVKMQFPQEIDELISVVCPYACATNPKAPTR